jgi:hypothetical protein
LGPRTKGITAVVALVANLVLTIAGPGTPAGYTGAPHQSAPGGAVVETALGAAGTPRPISSTAGQGLWLVTQAGRVLAYGDARSYGDAHAATPVVGAAATPDGRGYWLVSRGGGVYSFGDATPLPSLGGRHLASAVVGMAATADGKGYWLASADGTVYGFGDATGTGPGSGPGSGPGGAQASPVVGIVADPGTGGYWLARANGAVVGYRGAPTYRRAHLPAAVVAVAATPDGQGYWVVARDGRTTTRGDASRHGALNGAYDQPVVGMAAAAGGSGYWLATANGHVFAYGAAGTVVPPPGSPRVVAIVAAPAAAPARLAAGAPGGLSVATTTLPDLVAGQPYSAQLAASGGTSPYSWTVIGGALPPGLAMSAAGAISGTAGPGLSGGSDFTVQVTDSSASSPRRATADLTVAASSAAPASLPLSQVPFSLGQSQNWSGYVATAGPYTEATGSFTVPSLSPATPAQDMVSEWVGIDGSDNGSLVQAGVTEAPEPYDTGVFDVFAWWEVLPFTSQPIPTMTVSAGDEVSVTIARVSGTSWTIHLTDRTNGQSYTQDVGYDGPGTSVEWIVEAPTESQTDQQLQLAPYSPAVNFGGLAATGSSAAITEVVMARQGQQVATPSGLGPAGFSVAYGGTAAAEP